VEDFFFYDKDAGKDSKGCKLTGDVISGAINFN
jgi:hypothetical protein